MDIITLTDPSTTLDWLPEDTETMTYAVSIRQPRIVPVPNHHHIGAVPQHVPPPPTMPHSVASSERMLRGQVPAYCKPRISRPLSLPPIGRLVPPTLTPDRRRKRSSFRGPERTLSRSSYSPPRPPPRTRVRPYTKVSLRSWSTTLKSSVRALRIHQLQPPALEPEEEREPHLENFDANIHTSADVVAPICKAELRLRRYRTNGTPLALLTDLQPVRGQYHVTIQNAVPISFNHNDEYCLWRNQLVTLFGVTAMLDLVQPQPPQVFAGPPTEPMPILGTSSVLPRGSPRLSEAFGIAFQELYQEHGYLPSEEIPVHWDRSWVAAVAEGLPLQDAHLYSGPLCREQGILPSASKVFTGYVHERAPGPNGARYEVNGRPTALHSGVEGLPVLYARYPVRAIIAAVLCL